MKIKLLVSSSFGFMASLLWAGESVQNIQTIDGAQRARLEAIIGAGGGGGGSGGPVTDGNIPATFVTNLTSASATITGQGTRTLNIEVAASGAAAVTNAQNNFTTASTNIFNSLTKAVGNITSTGPLNNFGYPTGQTNIFGSQVLIGTNVFGDVNAGFVFAQNGAFNNVTFYGVSPTLFMGDTFGSSYLSLGRSSTDAILNSQGAGALLIKVGGVTTYTLDDAASTFGSSSSHVETHSGISQLYPSGFSFNSGLLTGGTGVTISNNTAFVTVGGITATNITVSTPNLLAFANTGSATNYVVSVNGGAGTATARNQFLDDTNSAAGINFTVNTINTNMNQRTFVEATCAFGAGGGAFIWTSTGLSPQGRFVNISAISTVTNTIYGWVQPNDPWAVSNFVGTVTTVPAESHAIRF